MRYDDFLATVKNRRSYRRFTSQPVPKESLEKVLDAARHAPSGGNSQPWEFVVVQDDATKRSITKACLRGYKLVRENDPDFYWAVSVQPHLYKAPVLIVICGNRRLEETYPNHLDKEILLRQSLAICIYTLQLAAASLGLATAWGTMPTKGRQTELRELLGIPEVYAIDHIIPLGYPDDEKEKRDKALHPVRRQLHSEDNLMKSFVTNTTICKNISRKRNLLCSMV